MDDGVPFSFFNFDEDLSGVEDGVTLLILSFLTSLLWCLFDFSSEIWDDGSPFFISVLTSSVCFFLGDESDLETPLEESCFCIEVKLQISVSDL